MLIASTLLSLCAAMLFLCPVSALHSRVRKCAVARPSLRLLSAAAADVAALVASHHHFLTATAKISPPEMMDVLFTALTQQGLQPIADPLSARRDINPLLIPLAKNTSDQSLFCYLRWPTQKEGMDLQLVKTNELGVELVALSTEKYCLRQLVEADFYAKPYAPELAALVNKERTVYTLGSYVSFVKSGKFPLDTERDLRLVLDRFLLTKVGPFLDCYERLAENFVQQKNDVSALVTCERAVALFYGWGRPMSFHAGLLSKIGRDKEARDTARSALAMPKWTTAYSYRELEDLVRTAGFTDSKILGDMHAFRAKDPRTKDIEEGVSPIQVSLDQAAHLMDAVSLRSSVGGWEQVRGELAEKYRVGGYPDMAAFIETV